jgi:hypothetical protein
VEEALGDGRVRVHLIRERAEVLDVTGLRDAVEALAVGWRERARRRGGRATTGFLVRSGERVAI